MALATIPFMAFKPKSTPYSVRTYGSFASTKAGDVKARVDLDSIKLKKKSFGIGITSDDNGVIMIWKGRIFKSATTNDQPINTKRVKAPKASFLIWSDVSKWDDYILPSTIRSTKDLEDEIEKIVSSQGLDISKPLPLILEGSPISANWYVLPTPESQKSITDYSGFFFENKIRAFGYYVGGEQGILSSAQTKLHIHVTDRTKQVIGHLDDIKMAGNMKLLLPRMGKKKEKKSK